MLKSELMDLLHDLDDDAVVYLEIGDKFKKVKRIYTDRDGDVFLSDIKEETL